MAKGLVVGRMAFGKPQPKGDLGAPSGFGGPPKPKPAAPPMADDDPDQDGDIDTDAGPDPDQDQDQGGSPTITPEAVAYRTADQQCNSCEYMGQGGDCAVLKMQVQENDGCNAHSPRSQQEQPGIETRGRLRGAYSHGGAYSNGGAEDMGGR